MKKKDLYYERIPTKLLREDIRYLGNILGRVIKKQEGVSFFNLVSFNISPSKNMILNKKIYRHLFIVRILRKKDIEYTYIYN